jgi:hypothetical protein
MIEDDDDDALRFESPEEGAAIERLRPGRVRLEIDVAAGKSVEGK